MTDKIKEINQREMKLIATLLHQVSNHPLAKHLEDMYQNYLGFKRDPMPVGYKIIPLYEKEEGKKFTRFGDDVSIAESRKKRVPG